MQNAKEILDRQFLEMRWRALSLAADLDRIQRAEGGTELLCSDSRLASLRSAFELLNEAVPNRAEQLQLLFSDTTPPPDRKSQIENRK